LLTQFFNLLISIFKIFINRVLNVIKKGNDENLIQIFNFVPISKQRTRTFIRFYRRFLKFGKYIPGFETIWEYTIHKVVYDDYDIISGKLNKI
jgi:hypothetical protein